MRMPLPVMLSVGDVVECVVTETVPDLESDGHVTPDLEYVPDLGVGWSRHARLGVGRLAAPADHHRRLDKYTASQKNAQTLKQHSSEL